MALALEAIRGARQKIIKKFEMVDFIPAPLDADAYFCILLITFGLLWNRLPLV